MPPLLTREIELPDIDAVPEDRRVERFAAIERQLRRVGPDVKRFNVRVLNLESVLLDLQWTLLVHDVFAARNVPDLELSGTGDTQTAALLRRLAALMPETLLHPLLKSERPELPKAVVWGFNDQTLRNPFLMELDGETDAVADRKYLDEHHGELAELLRVEAEGGPSYKSHFEAIERDRQLRDARTYSEVNPYLADRASKSGPTTLTVQNAGIIQELNRNNKILSEQLAREASLKGINPFAPRAKNLTHQEKCWIADAKLAAILKAAAGFEEKQIHAEDRAAEEAILRRRAQRQQPGGRPLTPARPRIT